MLEAFLGFITSLISSILPGLLKKKEASEHRKNYDEIRREVAEALSMYACCFYNPVDLADTQDHKLPSFYDEGSVRIRALAAKLKALAETLPTGKNDLPINADDMLDAARYLFGISNSFHTPYGMGSSSTDWQHLRGWEDELRRLLDLKSRNYK